MDGRRIRWRLWLILALAGLLALSVAAWYIAAGRSSAGADPAVVEFPNG